jgi:hypothetical protein
MRSIVLFLVTASIAYSQATDPANTACIEQLDIPLYPRLADLARVATKVQAIVRLGADGIVHDIEIQVERNTEPIRGAFRNAVERSLRSSRFVPACQGRTVALLFQFSLGEQTGNERVLFSYPNKFTILASAKAVQP